MTVDYGERYRFAALMACAVIAGAALIVAIQRIDLPSGVEKIVRPPENGVGTRCARGDLNACRQLCSNLSDVSTLKCVDHLASAFPRVHDGSRLEGGSGASGSGSSGGSQGSTGVPGSSTTTASSPTTPSGGGTGGGGGSGSGPPGPSGQPGPPGSPGPTGPPGGNGGGGTTTTTSICVQNPLLPVCVKTQTPNPPRLP